MKRTTSYIFGIVLLLILTLLGALIAHLYIQDIMTGDMDAQTENRESETREFLVEPALIEQTYEPQNNEEALDGVIHMTLTSTSETSDRPSKLLPLQIYEYRPGSSTKNVQRTSDLNYIAYTPDRRSSDGALVFGSLSPLIPSDIPATDLEISNVLATRTPQIYIKSGTEIEQISTTTETPSGNTIVRKRTPKIANTSNEVVYSAQAIEGGGQLPSVYPLDTWSIFKTNADTKKDEFVTSGAHAVWSQDDTHIFFVRSDGIYAKKTGVEVGAESRVISVPDGLENFRYDTQLQISADGNYLVFNHLNHRLENRQVGMLVSIYKLNYSEGFFPEAVLAHQIHIENGMVFWPILSPEGRYLILQVSESTDLDTVTFKRPRVSLFDARTGREIEEIALEGFDFHNTYVTSWSEL